jgi:hypothetical protein
MDFNKIMTAVHSAHSKQRLAIFLLSQTEAADYMVELLDSLHAPRTEWEAPLPCFRANGS